ncbi:HORMA domain-containing protein 1-like isoform X2 [Carettochelys insculpta]|uniref:HORMA domain-containing protein 1-like isoform X2 n=1 Tax=Carettochelys insculpta TaxID=44489 RepID=UPI003EBFDE2D
MATIQKFSTARKQDTCENQWATLFPREIKTHQQSLVLVKRIMAVAVSVITYFRGIFPEDAYNTRYLEDMCVKVLREDSIYPRASKIVKWMKGCFEALEKKYLQMMILGVQKNATNPNNMIESYEFKFRYTSTGSEMDVYSNKKTNLSNNTTEDIKRTCLLLINNLYFLKENIVYRPNDVSLTMKLFYYADVTPAEYQPPGFKEGESEFIFFEGIPVHVKVGEIETFFHMLKLKITKKEERMHSMDIHGILKERREDAKREKEQGFDTSGKHIDKEYEPPRSEEEFVDKYHKVNGEATRKRKISKKKRNLCMCKYLEFS